MRRLVHITAIIVTLTTAFPFNASAQRKMTESQRNGMFIDAVTLYSLQMYEESSGRFKLLADDDPNDAAPCFYLGNILAMQGKNVQAERYHRKACELCPDNDVYAQALAITYSVNSSKKKDAVEILEKLIQKNPRQTDNYYILFPIYFELKEYDKALETLSMIEGDTGTNPSFVRMRYNLLKEADRIEEGYAVLKNYYEGTDEDEISPDEWIFFSDVYLSADMDSLSLECLKKARTPDSSDKSLDFRIAQNYYDKGDYDTFFNLISEAFEDKNKPLEVNLGYYERLLKSTRPEFLKEHLDGYNKITQSLTITNPTDSVVLATVSKYYYETGQEESALSAVKVNSLAHPNNPKIALDYLIMLYGMRKWDTDFYEWADAAYKKFGYYDFREIVGFSYYLRGMNDEGIRFYEKVVRDYWNDDKIFVDCYTQMGQMYYRKYVKTGNMTMYNKALDCNAHVLNRDPDNLGALNNYAYFLSIRGKKLPKALEMSLRTVAAEPENPTYLDTAGYILYRMGRYEDARTYFKKAMACGGKSHHEILVHYADCLAALGDKTLADYYYNLAKETKSDE